MARAMDSRSKSNDETVLARGRENGIPVVQPNVGVMPAFHDDRSIAVDCHEEGATFATVTRPAPIRASPEKPDEQQRRFPQQAPRRNGGALPEDDAESP